MMGEFVEYRTGTEMRAAYVAAHRRLTAIHVPKAAVPAVPVPVSKMPVIEERPQMSMPRPIARMLAVVAKAHGMSIKTMVSPSRVRPVVLARFHAIAVLRSHRPKYSKRRIGELIGGRDHSTVCHAAKIWPILEAAMAKQICEVDRLL